MEEKKEIQFESALKLKKQIKSGFYKETIYFCIALTLLNFFLSFELTRDFNYIATIVLWAILVVIVPVSFFIFMFLIIKKEKLLKLIDFFSYSFQYILNYVFAFTMYLDYYHNKTTVSSLDTVVSLYSISWAVFGISIATFGLWVSMNYKREPRDSDDIFADSRRKRMNAIGSIFVSIAVVLNLIFLLSGVSYISNNNAVEKSSFYVAIIYISANTLLNVITFLLVPVIINLLERSSNPDPTFLKTCDKIIELETKTKQLNKLVEKVGELVSKIEEVDSSKVEPIDIKPNKKAKKKE